MSILQQKCQIHELLRAQSGLPVAVVAELHKLYAYCTVSELVCKQRVQSIKLVIGRQHRVVNHVCAREGDAGMENVDIFMKRKEIETKRRNNGKRAREGKRYMRKNERNKRSSRLAKLRDQTIAEKKISEKRDSREQKERKTMITKKMQPTNSNGLEGR